MLLQVPQERTGTAREAGLSIGLATSSSDIEAAQRLRHRVFVTEMGARTAGRTPGRDADIFDPWCEHIVLRDRATDRVVATCRILAAHRAKRIGAFHAEGHFDLTRLSRLKPGMAEIGRVCAHPEYRTAAAGRLLWRGVGSLMHERGFQYLIGCAPMPMSDRGAGALRAYRQVAARHLAPIEHRVRARNPLLPDENGVLPADDAVATLPPLIRAYLRAGAWIAGEPAWDAEFNTADLFFFLPVNRLGERRDRHPLAAAA